MESARLTRLTPALKKLAVCWLTPRGRLAISVRARIKEESGAMTTQIRRERPSGDTAGARWPCKRALEDCHYFTTEM